MSGNPRLPRLYNDHIGYMSNTILYFMQSDSPEAFKYNGPRQPPDWKYGGTSGILSYRFNEMGFRSQHDISSISNDPYIVTVGCSHTMGTGLFHYETYSHHLQELTGLPVYNMGLSAASNDVSLFNVTWLLTNYNPPHTIVYQRASSARMVSFCVDDPTEGQVIFIGPWIDKSGSHYYQDYLHLLTIAHKRGFTHLKDTMTEISLRQQCKKFGVNLIVLDIHEEMKHYSGEKDFARDTIHYGNAVNLHWANQILQKYKP